MEFAFVGFEHFQRTIYVLHNVMEFAFVGFEHFQRTIYVLHNVMEFAFVGFEHFQRTIYVLHNVMLVLSCTLRRLTGLFNLQAHGAASIV
jgi:hypothetical protein